MTTYTGTYSLEDLLAYDFLPASEFGFDNVARAIQDRLDFLNGQVDEQLSLLCEKSTDRRRVWGTSENFAMVEVDEFGAARTQKQTSGSEIDFPERKFEISTGWSNDYMMRATPADFAKKTLGIQNAYLEAIQKEIAFGLYNSANYSFVDTYQDNVTLAYVRAFLNADSSKIPNSPSGTAFTGSSHNHFVGTSAGSLAYGDIDTLIANVTEHGHTKGVTLFVSEAMVATLVALGSTKFTALGSTLIVPASSSASTVAKLDPEADYGNTLRGYWANRIPVVSRSWADDDVIICLALGASQKPLLYRQDKIATLRGLRSVGTYGLHPLTAETFESYFGISVWGRSTGACLDTATQTTYTIPTTLIRTV